MVALPILVQPDVIKKALAAAKHVLSEKPIAKDVTTAWELLSWCKDRQRKEVWREAENFRKFQLLEVKHHAFERAQRIGGNVTAFSKKPNCFVDPSQMSLWRRVPEHQGGFLLDIGIHSVSGLRYLLAACNEQIVSVAAFTSRL